MTFLAKSVFLVGALTFVPAASWAQDPPPAEQPAEQPAGECVAIMLPTVQGAPGSATDVATAVRDLFTSFLSGPSIRVIALDARLASQAREEAKQKGCDRMLHATLVMKRGGRGGLGRVLGRAGTTAAWHVPVGSAGAAAARGAVVAGAYAASEIASETRAKDEMRLTFSLMSSGGETLLRPKEEKAKAESDGEDLLTPLVQTASESLAAAIVGR